MDSPPKNTTYNPAPPPSLDPTSPIYLQAELKKLHTAIANITNYLNALNDRLKALEP
jgi:hypothetical protein